MTALRLLGRVSRTARRLRLGRPFAAARDTADAVFLALGRPPLRVTVLGVRLHGLRDASAIGIPRGAPGPDVVVDAGAHVGYTLLEAAGGSPDALLAELRALDLRVSYLDGATGTELPVAGPLAKGNLLCRREAAQ